MNVLILGENGVCTHNRKDIIEAFQQMLAANVPVGPAMVAVVLTDEYEGTTPPDVSFVKQALLRALIQLEEGAK